MVHIRTRVSGRLRSVDFCPEPERKKNCHFVFFYSGEMETRFIKETEMFFLAISRAKTSDRDLSRRNIFDRLQNAVNLMFFVLKSNMPFARFLAFATQSTGGGSRI